MVWIRALTALNGHATIDLDYVADPSTAGETGTLTTNQRTIQGVRWTNATAGPIIIELRRNQLVIQSRTISAGNTGSRDLTLDFTAAQRRDVSLNARWPV